MAKTADEARKAAMSKKPTAKSKGAPKGGGKGLSGDALVGRVSQSTINSIKKMGMAEALKLAGTNGKTSGGLAREFQEGVRRMYGAERLAAAKAKYGPAKSRSADEARGSTKSPKPVTRSADAARAAATKVSTKSSKPMAKKSGTTDPFARAVFGAGGAIKRAVTGGSNQGMTAAQVAAENKRRAAAVAAAKAKKNK